MNEIYYDMKIKTNGHTVFNRPISQTKIIQQISYYFQKYKLPINININKCESDKDINHSEETEDIDIEVLTQQLLLFQSNSQIEQYIETEKLLANDVQAKLTQLCKALISIARKGAGKIDLNFLKQQENFEERTITKQRLNQIQQKCMKNLALVQEQRKKLQLCVICWSSSSSKILMPCMHLVLCNQCPSGRVCPVCKSQIIRTASVYR